MEENTAKEMIIIFAQEQYSLEGKGVAMLTTLLHEPFKQLYLNDCSINLLSKWNIIFTRMYNNLWTQ